LALAALQLSAVKYLSYPPAIWCSTWGGALLWLWLSGDVFVPIDDRTLLLIIFGAAAFCVGGLLGWRVVDGRTPAFSAPDRTLPALPPALISGLVAALCLLTPLYLYRLVSFIGQTSPLDFLYALRVRTLETQILGGIGIIANVVPFAMMVAWVTMAVTALTLRARILRLAALSIAVLVAVLTGGRGAPLTLIIGAMAIATIRSVRFPVREFVIGLGAALLIFGAMGVLIRKGTAQPEADWRSNMASIVDNLRLYTIGGVVALDRLVEDPQSVSGNGGFLRNAMEIANRLGGRYEVPPLHQPFTSVGNGADTNVYTIYGVYLQNVGSVALLAVFTLLGIVSAATHRYAIRGSFTAILFHSILVGAAAQSIFNDAYLTNLNFIGKLIVFVLGVKFFIWLFHTRTDRMTNLLGPIS
jgi:oligosaccharide repeat unit polymerase